MIDHYKELEKRLETFKSAKEWSDFISMLSVIDKSIRNFPNSDTRLTSCILCNSGKNFISVDDFLREIVPIHLFYKRLNQCLNPTLPAGVHVKVMDVYLYLLKKVNLWIDCAKSNDKKNKVTVVSKQYSYNCDDNSELSSSFCDHCHDSKLAYTLFMLVFPGLFTFFSYSKLLAKPNYLDLISYILTFQFPFSQYLRQFLLGLLPGLGEDKEIENRTLGLLFDLYDHKDCSGIFIHKFKFWSALWEVFLSVPGLRSNICTFLILSKKQINDLYISYINSDFNSYNIYLQDNAIYKNKSMENSYINPNEFNNKNPKNFNIDKNINTRKNNNFDSSKHNNDNSIKNNDFDSNKHNDDNTRKNNNFDSGKNINDNYIKNNNIDSNKHNNGNFIKSYNIDPSKHNNDNSIKNNNIESNKHNNYNSIKNYNIDSSKHNNDNSIKKHNIESNKHNNYNSIKNYNIDTSKHNNDNYIKNNNFDSNKHNNDNTRKNNSIESNKHNNGNYIKNNNFDSSNHNNDNNNISDKRICTIKNNNIGSSKYNNDNLINHIKINSDDTIKNDNNIIARKYDNENLRNDNMELPRYNHKMESKFKNQDKQDIGGVFFFVSETLILRCLISGISDTEIFLCRQTLDVMLLYFKISYFSFQSKLSLLDSLFLLLLKRDMGLNKRVLAFVDPDSYHESILSDIRDNVFDSVNLPLNNVYSLFILSLEKKIFCSDLVGLIDFYRVIGILGDKEDVVYFILDSLFFKSMYRLYYFVSFMEIDKLILSFNIVCESNDFVFLWIIILKEFYRILDQCSIKNEYAKYGSNNKSKKCMNDNNVNDCNNIIINSINNNCIHNSIDKECINYNNNDIDNRINENCINYNNNGIDNRINENCINDHIDNRINENCINDHIKNRINENCINDHINNRIDENCMNNKLYNIDNNCINKNNVLRTIDCINKNSNHKFNKEVENNVLFYSFEKKSSRENQINLSTFNKNFKLYFRVLSFFLKHTRLMNDDVKDIHLPLFLNILISNRDRINQLDLITFMLFIVKNLRYSPKFWNKSEEISSNEEYLHEITKYYEDQPEIGSLCLNNPFYYVKINILGFLDKVELKNIPKLFDFIYIFVYKTSICISVILKMYHVLCFYLENSSSIKILDIFKKTFLLLIKVKNRSKYSFNSQTGNINSNTNNEKGNIPYLTNEDKQCKIKFCKSCKLTIDEHNYMIDNKKYKDNESNFFYCNICLVKNDCNLLFRILLNKRRYDKLFEWNIIFDRKYENLILKMGITNHLYPLVEYVLNETNSTYFYASLIFVTSTLNIDCLKMIQSLHKFDIISNYIIDLIRNSNITSYLYKFTDIPDISQINTGLDLFLILIENSILYRRFIKKEFFNVKFLEKNIELPSCITNNEENTYCHIVYRLCIYLASRGLKEVFHVINKMYEYDVINVDDMRVIDISSIYNLIDYKESENYQDNICNNKGILHYDILEPILSNDLQNKEKDIYNDQTIINNNTMKKINIKDDIQIKDNDQTNLNNDTMKKSNIKDDINLKDRDQTIINNDTVKKSNKEDDNNLKNNDRKNLNINIVEKSNIKDDINLKDRDQKIINNDIVKKSNIKDVNNLKNNDRTNLNINTVEKNDIEKDDNKEKNITIKNMDNENVDQRKIIKEKDDNKEKKITIKNVDQREFIKEKDELERNKKIINSDQMEKKEELQENSYQSINFKNQDEMEIRSENFREHDNFYFEPVSKLILPTLSLAVSDENTFSYKSSIIYLKKQIPTFDLLEIVYKMKNENEVIEIFKDIIEATNRFDIILDITKKAIEDNHDNILKAIIRKIVDYYKNFDDNLRCNFHSNDQTRINNENTSSNNDLNNMRSNVYNSIQGNKNQLNIKQRNTEENLVDTNTMKENSTNRTFSDYNPMNTYKKNNNDLDYKKLDHDSVKNYKDIMYECSIVDSNFKKLDYDNVKNYNDIMYEYNIDDSDFKKLYHNNYKNYEYNIDDSDLKKLDHDDVKNYEYNVNISDNKKLDHNNFRNNEYNINDSNNKKLDHDNVKNYENTDYETNFDQKESNRNINSTIYLDSSYNNTSLKGVNSKKNVNITKKRIFINNRLKYSCAYYKALLYRSNKIYVIQITNLIIQKRNDQFISTLYKLSEKKDNEINGIKKYLDLFTEDQKIKIHLDVLKKYQHLSQPLLSVIEEECSPKIIHDCFENEVNIVDAMFGGQKGRISDVMIYEWALNCAVNYVKVEQKSFMCECIAINNKNGVDDFTANKSMHTDTDNGNRNLEIESIRRDDIENTIRINNGNYLNNGSETKNIRRDYNDSLLNYDNTLINDNNRNFNDNRNLSDKKIINDRRSYNDNSNFYDDNNRIYNDNSNFYNDNNRIYNDNSNFNDDKIIDDNNRNYNLDRFINDKHYNSEVNEYSYYTSMMNYSLDNNTQIGDDYNWIQSRNMNKFAYTNNNNSEKTNSNNMKYMDKISNLDKDYFDRFTNYDEKISLNLKYGSRDKYRYRTNYNYLENNYKIEHMNDDCTKKIAIPFVMINIINKILDYTLFIIQKQKEGDKNNIILIHSTIRLLHILEGLLRVGRIKEAFVNLLITMIKDGNKKNIENTNIDENNLKSKCIILDENNEDVYNFVIRSLEILVKFNIIPSNFSKTWMDIVQTNTFFKDTVQNLKKKFQITKFLLYKNSSHISSLIEKIETQQSFFINRETDLEHKIKTLKRVGWYILAAEKMEFTKVFPKIMEIIVQNMNINTEYKNNTNRNIYKKFDVDEVNQENKNKQQTYLEKNKSVISEINQKNEKEMHLEKNKLDDKSIIKKFDIDEKILEKNKSDDKSIIRNQENKILEKNKLDDKSIMKKFDIDEKIIEKNKFGDKSIIKNLENKILEKNKFDDKSVIKNQENKTFLEKNKFDDKSKVKNNKIKKHKFIPHSKFEKDSNEIVINPENEKTLRENFENIYKNINKIEDNEKSIYVNIHNENPDNMNDNKDKDSAKGDGDINTKNLTEINNKNTTDEFKNIDLCINSGFNKDQKSRTKDLSSISSYNYSNQDHSGLLNESENNNKSGENIDISRINNLTDANLKSNTKLNDHSNYHNGKNISNSAMESSSENNNKKKEISKRKIFSLFKKKNKEEQKMPILTNKLLNLQLLLKKETYVLARCVIKKYDLEIVQGLWPVMLSDMNRYIERIQTGSFGQDEFPIILEIFKFAEEIMGIFGETEVAEIRWAYIEPWEINRNLEKLRLNEQNDKTNKNDKIDINPFKLCNEEKRKENYNEIKYNNYEMTHESENKITHFRKIHKFLNGILDNENNGINKFTEKDDKNNIELIVPKKWKRLLNLKKLKSIKEIKGLIKYASIYYKAINTGKQIKDEKWDLLTTMNEYQEI